MNKQLNIPNIDSEEYIVLIDNPKWLKHFIIVNTDTEVIKENGNLILLGAENGKLQRSKQLSTIKQFLKLSASFKKKTVIVQGKCDYPFPQKYIQELPDSVVAIYSNVITEKGPKLNYLPMGRDFRSKAVYMNNGFSKVKKNILCYSNFSLDTWLPREKIFDQLKNKDFIHFEMGQRFSNYTISREQFYFTLASSKFAIAPRGNGADSFRFWDCLYLGTVPITVRENYHSEFEDKLPMLLLDSIDDYHKLNKAFLLKKYEEICSRKYDYNLLKLSTWIKKIKSGLK